MNSLGVSEQYERSMRAHLTSFESLFRSVEPSQIVADVKDAALHCAMDREQMCSSFGCYIWINSFDSKRPDYMDDIEACYARRNTRHS